MEIGINTLAAPSASEVTRVNVERYHERKRDMDAGTVELEGRMIDRNGSGRVKRLGSMNFNFKWS